MACSQPAQNIEYTVYIHHAANQNNHFWERASITYDAELALEQAEMLYESRKYSRVEIKKKFFCQKTKRRVAETFKIFDTSAKKSLWRKFLSMFS